MKSFKIIRILSFLIIVCALITTVVGLFWQDGGEAFYVQSVHGERVKMFGNGLYATESFFEAPINKGTDAVTLFVVVPLFLSVVLLNKRNSLKLRLLYLGLLSYLLYYAASLAFGVSYNELFVVYIIFFSLSLYTFVLGMSGIDTQSISDKVKSSLPHRGVAIFMFLAGLSVFVWLIEIIGAIVSGNPPGTLGINTTEPTFVLDLGIIAPSAFIGGALILRKKPLGYILSSILLTLNALVGVMVIAQTVFQKNYGVNITLGEFIAYVGVFVLMSLIATILNIRVLRSIRD